MKSVQEDRRSTVSERALTRRDAFHLASLAALSIALPNGAQAVSVEVGFQNTIARARIAIAEAMLTADTPAATIALTSRSQVIWSEAFGAIDKVAGTRTTEDTLFCIGSCSKVIAAAAIMILVDRHLVDLDVPIATYLPDFEMRSPDYDQITVRMLLNHASGFAGTNYRNAFTSEAHPSYQKETIEALKHQRLKHNPGEYSVYCNDGFTVAEWLVEKVTGSHYTLFVEQELLRPLGMMNSRYATNSFPAGSYAPAHQAGLKQPMEFVNLYGSGGLYSTPNEMTAFLRMLLNDGVHDGRRILSSASIAAMAENQTLRATFRPVDMADGYGLGWDGVKHGGFATSGITAWHKSGGTSVYSSFMIVLPDEGLAVITSGASPAYNAANIAERVLGEALVEGGRLNAQPRPTGSFAAVPAGAPDSDTMPGIYAYYAGVTRIIEDSVDGLIMSDLVNGDWSSDTASLRQKPEGSYVIGSDPSTSFQPLLMDDQTYLIAHVAYGLGNGLISVPYLQKMQPRKALSMTWKRRLGQSWLLVNEAPSSLLWGLLPPTLDITEVPDLSGYVLINSAACHTNNQIADASDDDSIARMCLKIPAVNSRDLNDLEVIPRQDGEWIRLGGYVFQPQATVPLLPGGSSIYETDSTGYGTWLKIDTGTSRSLGVNGAKAWKLFDDRLRLVGSSNSNITNKVEVLGQRAHYLLIFANAGSITRIDN